MSVLHYAALKLTPYCCSFERCMLYLLITLPYAMISAHTTMSTAPPQLMMGALWEC